MHARVACTEYVEEKGLQILLRCSQPGPGRKTKQVQQEISRNHVQTIFLIHACSVRHLQSKSQSKVVLSANRNRQGKEGRKEGRRG